MYLITIIVLTFGIFLTILSLSRFALTPHYWVLLILIATLGQAAYLEGKAACG